MEEARAVLTRLRRIELLERERAAPAHVLAEVRALLDEAEAWARRDRAGEAVEEAIASCRAALAEGRQPVATA